MLIVMRKLIIFVAITLYSIASYSQGVEVNANLKIKADSLYSAKAYSEACNIYADLLRQYPDNAHLWYNIGNCQYRMNHIAQAILAYERSTKIDPSNPNVRHNLTLARAKTEDGYYSASDLDIVFSFNTIVNLFSADGWAWASVVMLALLLALICFMTHTDKPKNKKYTFVGIVISAFAVILFNVFAMIQSSKITDSSHAVVMTTTSLMSTPDTTGVKHTVIHGGTKVTITDTTIHSWTEISLPDGKRGWVVAKDIEII